MMLQTTTLLTHRVVTEVVTICPQMGSASSVLFFDSPPQFQWNVPPGDIVNIYDGPTTASALLGSFDSTTDPAGFSSPIYWSCWWEPKWLYYDRIDLGSRWNWWKFGRPTSLWRCLATIRSYDS